MFEIKVTVDLPGIPEAINNLAAALALQTAPGANEGATRSAEALRVGYPPAETVNMAPEPVPILTPVPGAVSHSAPPVSPDPVKKVYTFDEISKAGAELCNQGPEMTDRLVALLQTKYGVDSIVDLGEEHFNELAADLQTFGAQMG